MLKRLAALWLILEKVSIAFSCVVNLILVLVLIGVGATFLLWGPPLETLPDLLPEVAEGINDLEQATIKRDIQIKDTTIPVRFELPVAFELPITKTMDVQLVDPVPLTAWTYIALPGGGGNLRASVSLQLPRGMVLPVKLYEENRPATEHIKVPVSTSVTVSEVVPITMTVPVAIPIRETELKKMTDRFNRLLEPYLRWWTQVLPVSSEEQTVDVEVDRDLSENQP
jgi:hypothetical protein